MKTLALALAFAAALAAQPVDRTKPPATPPIPDFKMPASYETTLPNGLRVVLLEDSRFPLVTLRLGFAAGSRYDPAQMDGLSETVAALLTEGTTTRSSRQIAEEVAAMGGTLSGSSDADSLLLAGNALAENTAKLLALVADVARHPAFPENELKLRIANREQELQLERSQASFLMHERFNQVVYGANPYARIAPTAASLNRIDRAALESFQHARLAPNEAVLLLIGKLPPRAEIMRLVGQQFGSWQRQKPPAAPGGAIPAPRRQIELVDRPHSAQADIAVGRRAVTRSDPDHIPLLVAANILGGGASSRMFTDIREKQGFAYDAHTEFARRKDAGTFAAVTEVRNEVFAPALKAVLEELTRMAREPVSGAELAVTQNRISGTFLLPLETQDGLAAQVITVKLMGLPNDYLEKFTSRVRAVTPAQVQAVARKYMDPEQADIVVVGDASQVQKPLEQFGSVHLTKAE